MMPRSLETVVHAYSSFVMQRVETLLNCQRLNVLCDLIAQSCDKGVPNIVLKDGHRVLRLWTSGELGVDLDLEVVFRKLIELDPARTRIGAVDPDRSPSRSASSDASPSVGKSATRPTTSAQPARCRITTLSEKGDVSPIR